MSNAASSSIASIIGVIFGLIASIIIIAIFIILSIRLRRRKEFDAQLDASWNAAISVRPERQLYLHLEENYPNTIQREPASERLLNHFNNLFQESHKPPPSSFASVKGNLIPISNISSPPIKILPGLNSTTPINSPKQIPLKNTNMKNPYEQQFSNLDRIRVKSASQQPISPPPSCSLPLPPLRKLAPVRPLKISHNRRSKSLQIDQQENICLPSPSLFGVHYNLERSNTLRSSKDFTGIIRFSADESLAPPPIYIDDLIREQTLTKAHARTFSMETADFSDSTMFSDAPSDFSDVHEGKIQPIASHLPWANTASSTYEAQRLKGAESGESTVNKQSSKLSNSMIHQWSWGTPSAWNNVDIIARERQMHIENLV